MLLYSNWGKFKTFVTSYKEPEPAAQARASSAACLPPTDLAGLGCCQQLSHPGSQAPAFTSGLPQPTWTGPCSYMPVMLGKGSLSIYLHKVAMAQKVALAQGWGTGVGG